MKLALKPIQRSHSFDLSTTPSSPNPISHEQLSFKVKGVKPAKLTMLPVGAEPLESRTFSQNNLMAKVNKPKGKFNIRPSYLQGSLEGLNQELENLSVESNSFLTHKSDTIPDGHRAPVNELLYLFRDSPNNINIFLDPTNNESYNKSNTIVKTQKSKLKDNDSLKVNLDKNLDANFPLASSSGFDNTHQCSFCVTKETSAKSPLRALQRKSAQLQTDLVSRKSISPSLLSPQPPSLPSPLPPIEHLSFNYPTPLQPTNQPVLNKTSFDSKEEPVTTSSHNNSNNDNNNNSSLTNNNSSKISNKQLLIPSNQSAFTSVSKLTPHTTSHNALTSTSLK